MSNSNDGVAIALTLAGPAKRSGGPEDWRSGPDNTRQTEPYRNLGVPPSDPLYEKNSDYQGLSPSIAGAGFEPATFGL